MENTVVGRGVTPWLCHQVARCYATMRPMTSDPLRLNDVALTLPVDDPAESAALYSQLFGEHGDRWGYPNGSIGVVDRASGPSRAAFHAVDVVAATKLLARRGRPLDDAGQLETAPALGITSDAGAQPGPLTLDHVVFATETVDAAVALFAGCLGLDFRLVRQFGDLSQVFFRSGSVVVEVLAGGDQASPGVALWGLAWRCADIDAEHARLAGAGLALSEIRVGRKPGTRVATIREAALGIPTILIEQSDPAA